jgi:aquaporin Z
MKKIFLRNYRLYLMEALGLGLFMFSACGFTALLQNPSSPWFTAIPSENTRFALVALAMAITAVFIFYSPFTAPSGSHINPAVTLVFLRMGWISRTNAFFYMLFQFAGGLVAVYLMVGLLGPLLTGAPVNYVVTVPGKNVSFMRAAVYEFTIAFIMITMILNTSTRVHLKKYTRVFSGMLIFLYVIFTAKVSGFGMNPARSFASALPAHNWTGFWIYLLCPVAGMSTAAEIFLLQKRKI